MEGEVVGILSKKSENPTLSSGPSKKKRKRLQEWKEMHIEDMVLIKIS